MPVQLTPQGCYINLLSNSLNGFPNSPSDFTNVLDEPLYTPQGLSVCLTEISYKAVHMNDDDTAYLEILDWYYENEDGTYGKIIKVVLGKKELVSGNTLVKFLNDGIKKEMPRRIKKLFMYDPVLVRIWVSFEPDCGINMKIHGGMLDLLGVQTTHSTRRQYLIIGISKDKTKKLKYDYKRETRFFHKDCQVIWPSTMTTRDYFKYPPELTPNDTFMVLSNLGVPQKIASGQAGLLRFVSFPYTPGTLRVTRNYGGSPQYITLKSQEIQYIRDLYNRPITLLSAYTRIMLHIQVPS